MQNYYYRIDFPSNFDYHLILDKILYNQTLTNNFAITSMKTMLLVGLILCCYLGSAVTTGIRLFWNNEIAPPRLLALGLGVGGLLFHALLLHDVIVTPLGINLGFFNMLSLVVWTVLAILLTSSATKPVDNLGIALFPLAVIVVGLERSLPTYYFMSQGPVWGIKLHILVSLLAYSILTLASMQALLLAIQDYHLHSHHPGGFIRALPPLQTMEELLFEMIGAGFFLLTLSLLSGFMFIEDMFAQHLGHKTVLAVLGWLLFAILLWGRLRAGWRGRTAIVWTLSGFMVLMLAYFGSKAVLELILQRR